MHVAPVLLVAHQGGPEAWSLALSKILSVLDDRPLLPLTIRFPGAAIEYLSRDDAASWERLSSHPAMWLAGGWSDPVLTHLPPLSQRLQLDREQSAMEAAGITPGALWTADAWEPALVELARGSGLSMVLVDENVVVEPIDRPAVVDRAGATVVVAPVIRSPVPDDDDDGLAVVRAEPDSLADLADSHWGRLTTPDAYLEEHLPGGRISLGWSDPGREGDVETFYRQLLRVTADQPQRGAGLDGLLTLQSRQFTSGRGGGWEANQRLIDVRLEVDRATHRGDSWVTVGEVDWDGDGLPEVQIETAAYSLVVDPTEATLLVWDDKTSRWPILAVRPSLAAVLIRRMTEDGEEPQAGRLHLERRTEGRAEALIDLRGGDGEHCQISIVEGALNWQLTLPPTDPVRVGPEIPLLLDSARAMVRVDGGKWIEANAPLALSGHRFRFRDDRHTMLVSTTRPAELFARPLDGEGLIAWPHFTTTGDVTYGVSFTPS